MTLERLDFESGVVGRSLGRLRLPEADRASLPGLLAQARAAGFAHLVAHVDASDARGAQTLAEHGFRQVDDAIVVRRGSAEMVPGARPRGLRAARPQDLQPLLQRCGTVFRHSRFYRDDFFSEAQAEAIYRQWIVNCFGGRASLLRVASDDRGVCGFVAARLEAAHAVAWIELLAVASDAAGQGLGRRLLSAALCELHGRVDAVRVKTQADNAAALALYGRVGFEPVARQRGFALRLDSWK
ncbi:MAG: GNAT family N-acetyltransferase [Myxococcales bacterium]|nr:GNAT family N-acetyltransferase [Myxococcales bacterium]